MQDHGTCRFKRLRTQFNWARPRVWVHVQRMVTHEGHQGVDVFWQWPCSWKFHSRYFRLPRVGRRRARAAVTRKGAVVTPELVRPVQFQEVED